MSSTADYALVCRISADAIPADDRGFVAIDECLRAEGGPKNVFAVGDVASCSKHPRPKAGVYAVRQGPPLTANLRR